MWKWKKNRGTSTPSEFKDREGRRSTRRPTELRWTTVVQLDYLKERVLDPWQQDRKEGGMTIPDACFCYRGSLHNNWVSMQQQTSCCGLKRDPKLSGLKHNFLPLKSFLRSVKVPRIVQQYQWKLLNIGNSLFNLLTWQEVRRVSCYTISCYLNTFWQFMRQYSPETSRGGNRLTQCALNGGNHPSTTQDNVPKCCAQTIVKSAF